MSILDRKIDEAKRGLEDDRIKTDRWLYEAFSGMIGRYEALKKISNTAGTFKLNEVTFNHGEKERAFTLDTFGTGYELQTFAGNMGAAVIDFEAPDGFRYILTKYGPINYIQQYKGKHPYSIPVRTVSPYFYFEPEAKAAGEAAAAAAGREWMENMNAEIIRLTDEIEFEKNQCEGHFPESLDKKIGRRNRLAEKYNGAQQAEKLKKEKENAL